MTDTYLDENGRPCIETNSLMELPYRCHSWFILTENGKRTVKGDS
jgi:hypothetical protein